MVRVHIVADEDIHIQRLTSALTQRGIECTLGRDTPDTTRRQAADLVLVELDGSPDCAGAQYLAERPAQQRLPPVIALISIDELDTFDPGVAIEDFVAEPWDATEVVHRVRRTLRRVHGIGRGESIQCGDLVIDLDNCEVTLSGRAIPLAFKEYELLKYLAGNRGRVFTREALLDAVWGYDYFGGDRTVDVHIRRLRSKIEDPTHTFIDTVRNIGYRFRKDA